MPAELPNDALELAKLAIKRITSVDPNTNITVFDTALDLTPEENADEKTWIVSGISPYQKEILNSWPRKSTLYVEGAFRVWLRGAQVNYFMLRGQARKTRPKFSEKSIDDLSQIRIWTHGETDSENLLPEASVHEQEDGTIFACCATGTSTKDSLLSWIRLLEKEVPNINHMQILFTIRAPWSPIKPITKEELAIKPVK